jgi:hypothetical protein
LALVVVILVKPELRRASDGLDLWVLVDRSDSAADVLRPQLGEWEMLLEKSRGADDRLYFVDFAKEAVERGAIITAGSTEFSGVGTATRTTSAVRHALAQMKKDRSNRLLVLTDGYSTEPTGDLAERLLRENVPLDVRLAQPSVAGDVRLARLSVPRRVMLREAMVLEIVATGDADGTVPVELFRNGASVGKRDGAYSPHGPAQQAWGLPV